MYDMFTPKFVCNCGKSIYFPYGWYPTEFYCSNCGKYYRLGIDVGVEYPNHNYAEEAKKIKKEQRLSKLKILDGGKK